MLAVAAAPTSTHAWGYEAHKVIMERAIGLLPIELRPFFEQYKSTLVERVIDPDTWQVAGFDDQESPHHFLDLDWDGYGKYPYTGLPRDYTAAVAKFGKQRIDQNGTVPWRVEEMYGSLRRAFESYERRGPFGRFDVLFFSAWLTHYVSDAHVPFHAVFNYDGQLTNQHGIHARFEAYLFERYRDQWTIAPKPIAAVKNPRDYIFDVVLQGTQLVPPILKSDLDAIGTPRRVRRCVLRGVLQGQPCRARAAAQRVDCRLRGDDCRSVGSGGEAGDAAESAANDATSSAIGDGSPAGGTPQDVPAQDVRWRRRRARPRLRHHPRGRFGLLFHGLQPAARPRELEPENAKADRDHDERRTRQHHHGYADARGR